MAPNSFGYIELGRTFHQLSEYSKSDDEIDLNDAFRVGESLGWDSVLSEFRVILLSEAGSGKTEEIRAVTRRLQAKGKDAFFLRLENISDGLEYSFEEGSNEEFQHWLSSGNEGWILLDSVDEARLKSPLDFEKAISKLSVRLSTALKGTHIIITSKMSAWRPKTDMDFCERKLPFGTPNSTSEIFKIVSFDDLSSSQIELFLSGKGVSDIPKILDEVERKDAWVRKKKNRPSSLCSKPLFPTPKMQTSYFPSVKPCRLSLGRGFG